MTDIVELLENLSVSPHQQSIIDSAVDEIVGLRKALQDTASPSKVFAKGNDMAVALKLAKQAKEGK